MNRLYFLKRLLIPSIVGFFVVVAVTRDGAQKGKGKNNETYVMTEAELQSQVMSFADRFAAIIVTALEEYEDLSWRKKRNVGFKPTRSGIALAVNYFGMAV